MYDELGFNSQPAEPQAPAAPVSAPEPQPQYASYGQQQAPYYAQQTTYAPPPPPYTPYVSGKTGKGQGWITFLRVFLWIWFGILCLAGVIIFIGSFAAASSSRYFDGTVVLAGLGSMIGCFLLAFLSVAGGMIALDAAANIGRCATNSARILDLLQKKN